MRARASTLGGRLGLLSLVAVTASCVQVLGDLEDKEAPGTSTSTTSSRSTSSVGAGGGGGRVTQASASSSISGTGGAVTSSAQTSASSASSGAGGSVACTTSAQCTNNATPVCNPATNTCVQCVGPSDCTQFPTAPVCDKTTSTCVECTSSMNCSGGTPECDPQSHACVPCLPACSGATPVCNAASNTCVGCKTSTDCSGMTPVCDTTSGSCVACLATSDCPTPPACTTVACSATDTCVQTMAAAGTACAGTMMACNAAGTCVSSCQDGVQDHGETDVDCGGPCPGCALTRKCSAGTDCVSGECYMGTCALWTSPEAGYLAVGTTCACAVLINTSQVACWGSCYDGNLGSGGTASSLVPAVTHAFSAPACRVAVGDKFRCAVTNCGPALGVTCWGYGGLGDLGDGAMADSTTGVAVGGGVNPAELQIGGGSDHACVGNNDGSFVCWGDNADGDLGNGSTTASSSPITVSLPSPWSDFSVGTYFTCAILQSSGGVVSCWGYNGDGQLGDGTNTSSSTPVQVESLTNVTALAAGASHACAISQGYVSCWGDNSTNQLGNSGTMSVNSPIPVVNNFMAEAITAGQNHTCALASGAAWCWGSNAHGQLGNGQNVDSGFPVPVTGLGSGVRVLVAGGDSTCAIMTQGNVVCWGSNSSGQLGDGTTTDRNVPTAVKEN